MSYEEGNSNNHGQGSMELGEGMHMEGAYDVPLAWSRVLEAWNDPAVGAGVADSVLSGGEFEHSAHIILMLVNFRTPEKQPVLVEMRQLLAQVRRLLPEGPRLLRVRREG